MALGAGQTIREERLRRRWTLAILANRAGISPAHAAGVEAGEPASLETYARLMTALDLQPNLVAFDRRQRSSHARLDEDFVHAAMGDLHAARVRSFGFDVRIDEPYQHYQFAGRADVVSWYPTARALLHIENRTRFPNIQDALGSYGAKRAYLGRVLAERLGIRGGWASETHVVAALWSSEVLHVLRLRRTTFEVACPDPVDAFRGWWQGDVANFRGVTSSLVVFDPAPGIREAFRFAVLPREGTRPRYPSYAAVASALRRAERK
jgi:transcriptional regulator with XRE-family HTH domain